VTLRRYFRLLAQGLQARRAVLPWRQPGAPETLFWWLAVSLIFGGVWFALGGYHAVFRPLNSAWQGVPDWLAQCVTYSGDSLLALVLLLFAARRYPQVLWLALPSALIATLLSRGLKLAFDALRPGAVLPAGSFHLTGPLYSTHSFPSGHTVTAFTTAAIFAWFLPQAWMRWCAFALALLVGLSRVGVGAHWPIDVMAGMGAGTLSVLLGSLAARRWSWGLTPAGHFPLVAALAGCAVALLRREAVYPLATQWGRAVAAAALVVVICDYLVVPAIATIGQAAAVPLRRRRPAPHGGAAAEPVGKISGET
jgi:membrane-associated phospholipid phosphatase